MDKDMITAHSPCSHQPLGRLVGTGIKLKAVDKNTGEEVYTGIQLNNTTMEIEALPNLNVEVIPPLNKQLDLFILLEEPLDRGFSLLKLGICTSLRVCRHLLTQCSQFTLDSNLYYQ